MKRFWVADEDVHERTPINIEFGSHDIYVLASDHDAVCELLAAARLDKHELRADHDAVVAERDIAVDLLRIKDERLHQVANERDAALARVKELSDKLEVAEAVRSNEAFGGALSDEVYKQRIAELERDAALGRAIRSMDRLRLVGTASNYVCVELWREHPEKVHYPDFYTWLGLSLPPRPGNAGET